METLMRLASFFKKPLLTLYLCIISTTYAQAGINATTIQIPLHVRNVSLNPGIEQDFSSLWVSRQINCQLLRNQNGTEILEAAENISYISPTEIMFTLKKNIFFNNGAPVTAHDAIASLTYLKANRKVLRNTLNLIVSIKYLNDRQFIIKLSRPYPEFLYMFSAPNYSLFPENFLNAAKTDKSLWNRPITCGAYYVNHYDREYLSLMPRKHSYPIKFYFDPDGSITEKNPTNFDLLIQETKQKDLVNQSFTKVNIFDPFQFFYIPNTAKAPWNNTDARCAFLSRLNPHQVIAAYGSSVSPASDLIPEGTLGYDGNHSYIHAIQAYGTKKTIPKVSQFCYAYYNSSIEKNIRPLFLQMFKTIYPEAREVIINSKINMAATFQELNCDGIILVLKSNYHDAYEYLLLFSEDQVNVSGYNNLQLKNEIEDSKKYTSPQERYKQYRQVINYLQSQCLIYPLFTMPYEDIYVNNRIDAVNIGKGALDEYLLSQVKIK